MKRLFSLLIVAALGLGSMHATIKIHTIGDSTMADYDENTTDKRGWCMYLGSFFDAQNVTVNNRGKSGSDTRGFYTGAAYWASVKSQMSAGDYLLIQFAHNDEGTVTYGMDNLEYAQYCKDNSLPAPTDARGTNPQTTYRDYLRLFIDEARELGVNPVLVAPICRAYFANGDIKRNGRHDLGDKFSKIENGVLYENQSLPADDHSMDYVEAMKIVAKEKNVPFIDLMQATRELYLSYGETQCLKLLFCEGDKTHTNTMGANLIARQAAQLLKEAGILAEYISIPESVSASPNALDFGEVYSGVQQNKELLITGFGLQPATGSVSIASSGDVTISVDKTTYSQSATVNYEGSTLFQKIYVRATYTNEGEQNDNITVSFGNNTLAVPVTASVISLAGGSEVSALWPIVDKATVTNSTVTGPIAANCTMSHMMAADTKSDFTQGDETGITLVRFHNADDGGAKVAWPANEIDENATRYIDFAITAPGTMEVRITKISLDITSHSTSTMCYHINTGFGDNFTDVQTIAEKVNMTNLEIAHLELTPTLTIPAGETLHVRVLPWHNLGEAKSGKYICLRDVKIEGLAFEPGKEGIETIQQPEISSEKMLINGQLLIKRNGVFYHVNGQIVR
ncbi:MAG: hypothetical protein IKQ11_02980 [Paludibacteraceae bacterium]|nr:hypothetical protein [Paludibacteraceae bacterium]